MKQNIKFICNLGEICITKVPFQSTHSMYAKMYSSRLNHLIWSCSKTTNSSSFDLDNEGQSYLAEVQWPNVLCRVAMIVKNDVSMFTILEQLLQNIELMAVIFENQG